MKNGVKFIVVLGLLVGLIGAWQLWAPAQFSGNGQEFEVRRGEGAKTVARRLEERGLIRNQTVFYALVRLFHKKDGIRAGVFQLKPNYNVLRTIRILQEKEGAASLVKFTIPEGYTIGEIAVILHEKGLADREAFVRYARSGAKNDLGAQFPFLKDVPTDTLEGYIYPETYVFAKGAGEKAVMTEFLDTFQSKVIPLYDEAKAKMGLSLHDVVTLASIVEKESFGQTEMRTISGVFHNRLKRRMALQSCPTVAYALGEPRKKHLTYKDLKFPSDYNTYWVHGLPPGPIASPGKAAIEATLNPDTTPYLYFVANGDGSHQFSKSMKEHLRKQQQILKRNPGVFYGSQIN